MSASARLSARQCSARPLSHAPESGSTKVRAHVHVLRRVFQTGVERICGSPCDEHNASYGTLIEEEGIDSTEFVLGCGRDGKYLLSTPEEETAGPDLLQMLEHLRTSLMVHVANYARDRVFIHSGVIAWQGRAVLFPGTSFAGKTTLVAECVKAGATYFSDEYAVLDDCGVDHPYSRNLQIRQPGRPEQTSVPVTAFNGMPAIAGALVAQVLFTRHLEAAAWQPTPVTAGEAVLEMLCNAIPVQRDPARVLSTLATMMKTAKAYRSFRGEASGIVQQIFRSLE